MGLNEQVSAERVHIGFFGVRNAGKSSLVNAVTNQELSVVSNIAGTTTDPVQKAMELLPIGPVVIIDTPGIDDVGILGEKRVERTLKVLNKTDVAVLVVDGTKGIGERERELISLFDSKNVPYVIAYNKADDIENPKETTKNEIYVSALKKININELKELIASLLSVEKEEKHVVADLLSENDIAVLVVPIDSAAPKGRLILPQQQTIRDILDAGATALVTRETELLNTLKSLSVKPKIVITDSQAFAEVDRDTPKDIPLTSFSILFARYKGDLKVLANGATEIDKLKDGDTILISEGCTHHRQCCDIGTVKLPALIKKYTGKNINFEFTSGGDFANDLSKYALCIHCGGCMLNEREMKSRMKNAADKKLPMTNYGVAIAHMNGILKRALSPFNEII